VTKTFAAHFCAHMWRRITSRMKKLAYMANTRTAVVDWRFVTGLIVVTNALESRAIPAAGCAPGAGVSVHLKCDESLRMQASTALTTLHASLRRTLAEKQRYTFCRPARPPEISRFQVWGNLYSCRLSPG